MADLKAVLLDRTQPIEARIGAAKALSSECGEYSEVWNCLFPVIESETDNPAVRSAALAALSVRNPIASIQVLVRPFENLAVRRAAIEILDKLAPVTGEYEIVLTAQLSALRGELTEREIEYLPISSQWKQSLSATISQLLGSNHEVNRSCMVINLSQAWGRDPRVLAFLTEGLQQLDENRRRDAVFCLCMLGELQQVLDLANDQSPVVRSTLANRLGYYREAAGIKVLRRMMEDSNSEVAREAKTALRLLNQVEMPLSIEQPPRASPWGQLLTEISRVQLADRRIAGVMPDHKIAASWLGGPGASEAEIASAEQRLGVRLPPSYRAFLAEANGFDHVGPFIYRLYSAAEIDWFSVRNQDWIDAYQTGNDVSPDEHLADPENCVRFRAAYLSSCLQISEEGDSAVILLNPEVVNDDGEWETWFFANWNPGATRYRSFRAYVESELQSLKRLL